MTIPFISNDPFGPARYAVAIAIFYQKDRSDIIPKANAIYPDTAVDKNQLTDTSALIQDEDDVLEITFEKKN